MTQNGALAALDLGNHRLVEIAGFTVHADTVLASLVAAAVVAGFGLYVRARVTKAVPGRAQLLLEAVIGAVQGRVGSHVGGAGRRVVPLAVCLFGFILVASLFELLPGGSSQKLLPPPTGDLNLTLALAAVVIVGVHGSALRTRGCRGYLGHYLKPFWWFAPFNVIAEIAKPITLALRLFGNVFAGAVAGTLVLELMPPSAAVVPLLFGKLFAVAVALIQAFLFALLTILYYEEALAPRPVPTPEKVN
ncbi:MAG: F0F1 ATP synthase subunit A [Acidimicrobiales bacterium]